jgi:ABC-type multidrug transport system permease subunit
MNPVVTASAVVKRPRSLLRIAADVIWQTALSRLRIYLRRRGAFALDVLFPSIVAFLPLLLGQAVAGGDAGSNFSARVGTPAYVPFMLIGANVFVLVMRAIWDVGFWLRTEQNTGTLEVWHLAPASPLWVLGGVALFSALSSLLAFVLSFTLGCLLWRVNPFQGDLLLALAFLLVGLLPTYALSLFVGALVLRLKEADSLLALAQWLISILMGIYFPLQMLPAWLRWLAYLLPPAWVNNGVRAALLGLGYLLGRWEADLALLAALGLAYPFLSRWLVNRVSDQLRRSEGLGGF